MPGELGIAMETDCSAGSLVPIRTLMTARPHKTDLDWITTTAPIEVPSKLEFAKTKTRSERSRQ